MITDIRDRVKDLVVKITHSIVASIVRKGEWDEKDYQLQMEMENSIRRLVELVEVHIKEYREQASRERSNIMEFISGLYPDKGEQDPRFLIQTLKREIAREICSEVSRASF